MKKHMITFLLLTILLPRCSNKNSVQTEDQPTSPYPKAVEQNIDDTQLFFAFVAAASIGDIQGLAVARNSIIVAEEYYNNAGPNPDPDHDGQGRWRWFSGYWRP